MKKVIFNVSFILSTLLFFGCASNGFLMAKPKVTMFSNEYPQKGEGDTLDVYVTNKPNKEYVEFAKITCGDTNEKWCLTQISKKAREIGADAIIIIGKAGTSGVGIPIGNSTYIVSEEYGMTAIAIKFK